MNRPSAQPRGNPGGSGGLRPPVQRKLGTAWPLRALLSHALHPRSDRRIPRRPAISKLLGMTGPVSLALVPALLGVAPTLRRRGPHARDAAGPRGSARGAADHAVPLVPARPRVGLRRRAAGALRARARPRPTSSPCRTSCGARPSPSSAGCRRRSRRSTPVSPARSRWTAIGSRSSSSRACPASTSPPSSTCPKDPSGRSRRCSSPAATRRSARLIPATRRSRPASCAAGTSSSAGIPSARASAASSGTRRAAAAATTSSAASTRSSATSRRSPARASCATCCGTGSGPSTTC